MWCVQTSILVAADAMWGMSYSASCKYLTDTANNATADTGSCNDLSDGFAYLVASHLFIAIAYTCVLMSSIWMAKVWQTDNMEENMKEELKEAGPTFGESLQDRADAPYNPESGTNIHLEGVDNADWHTSAQTKASHSEFV